MRNAVETQNLASLHSKGYYMFLYVNILGMHSETPQCDVSTKKTGSKQFLRNYHSFISKEESP